MEIGVPEQRKPVDRDGDENGERERLVDRNAIRSPSEPELAAHRQADGN